MSTGSVFAEPPQAAGLLSHVRYAELQSLRSLLPRGAKVLEIGGGNGFQAACLAAWGYDVASVDLGQGDWAERHYPVIPYDGIRLPFRDCAFDVIFSSNVLEHVADLQALLSESRRVLRVGGFALHVLPSSAWRLWTSLAHYPWLIGYALFKQRDGHGRALAAPSDVVNRHGIWGTAKRVLFPPAHGVDTSSLREILSFARRRWIGEFAKPGFIVECDWPMGLFYTGYCGGAGLDLRLRRALAPVFGSACRAYLLRAEEPGGVRVPGRSGGAAT